jgi:hypothetical protein
MRGVRSKLSAGLAVVCVAGASPWYFVPRHHDDDDDLGRLLSYYGRTISPCSRQLIPTITPDVHPVAPTTKDRQEMLEPVARVVDRENPRLERPSNTGE